MTLVDTGFRAKIAIMLAQTHQTMGTDAAIIDGYYRQALNIGDPHYSPLAAVALGNRSYAREGASPEALSVTRRNTGFTASATGLLPSCRECLRVTTAD